MLNRMHGISGLGAFFRWDFFFFLVSVG
jgi:hypothetical protein